MRVLVAQDHHSKLRPFGAAIRQAVPEAKLEVLSIDDYAQVGYNYHIYDVIFVDVDAFGGHGIELARRLCAMQPHANVALAARDPKELLPALDIHCTSFITGDPTVRRIKQVLSNLRYPVPTTQAKPSLYVRCFGSFEMFYDNRPLSIARNKCKELFAYLVLQQGAMCTVGEIESVLWELRPYRSSNQSYLRHLVATLSKTLRSCGLDDVLVKERGRLGINPSALTCDYYEFLSKSPNAPQYTGQFMSQYSWAEPTRAALDKMLSANMYTY